MFHVYNTTEKRIFFFHSDLPQFRLFHGHFVIDSPVPTKLLNMCAIRTEREFTHVRYTAATCDPNDFKDSGFTLRQCLYEPRRRTELFIVVTMYNEAAELFCRTMHGVIQNIAHLCTRDRSKTWGRDAWKKVVVCVVADGRKMISSRALSVMATMGIYQDGLAKVSGHARVGEKYVKLMNGQNLVNSKPVTAHIYEYSTQSMSYVVFLPFRIAS
jgi:chitin synthase